MTDRVQYNWTIGEIPTKSIFGTNNQSLSSFIGVFLSIDCEVPRINEEKKKVANVTLNEFADVCVVIESSSLELNPLTWDLVKYVYKYWMIIISFGFGLDIPYGLEVNAYKFNINHQSECVCVWTWTWIKKKFNVRSMRYVAVVLRFIHGSISSSSNDNFFF